jgi:hypothetical protein
MTAPNLGNIHSRFVVIYFDGEGVPISFPLEVDGLSLVTSLRLSLRFWLSKDFIFIDEEVYDAFSRHLINTIEQSPICDGDSKQWMLRPGRFWVYNMSDSVMAASTELVTHHRSSTCTIQLTPASWLKVEHIEELIIILRDDSNGNSPQ